MNLGFLRGARREILIGFDMRDGAKKHFFGDHPKNIGQAHTYAAFPAQMSAMAADLAKHKVEVLNCSKFSALNFWPKISLEDALAIAELDRFTEEYRAE